MFQLSSSCSRCAESAALTCVSVRATMSALTCDAFVSMLSHTGVSTRSIPLQLSNMKVRVSCRNVCSCWMV